MDIDLSLLSDALYHQNVAVQALQQAVAAYSSDPHRGYELVFEDGRVSLRPRRQPPLPVPNWSVPASPRRPAPYTLENRDRPPVPPFPFPFGQPPPTPDPTAMAGPSRTVANTSPVRPQTIRQSLLSPTDSIESFHDDSMDVDGEEEDDIEGFDSDRGSNYGSTRKRRLPIIPQPTPLPPATLVFPAMGLQDISGSFPFAWSLRYPLLFPISQQNWVPTMSGQISLHRYIRYQIQYREDLLADPASAAGAPPPRDFSTLGVPSRLRQEFLVDMAAQILRNQYRYYAYSPVINPSQEASQVSYDLCAMRHQPVLITVVICGIHRYVYLVRIGAGHHGHYR